MPLIPRTIRLSSRLWEDVDRLAVEDGVSSAEIVREAVIRMLERVQVEQEREEAASRRKRKST